MADIIDTFFKVMPILRDEKHDDIALQVLLALWSVMSVEDRMKATRYAEAINKALEKELSNES